MREKIKEKFSNVKHKWISFHIDENFFQTILYTIDDAVKSGKIKSSNAINLVSSFKEKEIAWIKFIRPVGRKDIKCECQIIDKDNNKIDITLSPKILLDAQVMSNTPKALKLYSKGKKTKGNWKKPDDGFDDPIEYPPVDEELTELGYEMYKDWELEIKQSGLTREEYKKKLFGIPFFTWGA